MGNNSIPVSFRTIRFELNKKIITYSSFGFDVFQLPLCTFSNALTSPQLVANHRVSETHQTDGHEVRYNHKRDVITEMRTIT